MQRLPGEKWLLLLLPRLVCRFKDTVESMPDREVQPAGSDLRHLCAGTRHCQREVFRVLAPGRRKVYRL